MNVHTNFMTRRTQQEARSSLEDDFQHSFMWKEPWNFRVSEKDFASGLHTSYRSPIQSMHTRDLTRYLACCWPGGTLLVQLFEFFAGNFSIASKDKASTDNLVAATLHCPDPRTSKSDSSVWTEACWKSETFTFPSSWVGIALCSFLIVHRPNSVQGC